MRATRPVQLAAACALALTALTACGSSAKKPVGPNVVGEALPQAETELKAAGITYSEHAKDATFGILVKDNFVVCDEKYVSPHEVRLDAAKHGC